MDLQHLRLLLVQGTEPYRQGIAHGTLNNAQLTILEGLTTWGFQLQEVGVVGWASEEVYDDLLDTGVRVIGSGLPNTNAPILKKLADFCPTHIVVDTPEPALFRWALRNQVRCIAMFQDVLEGPGIKQRWDNYQLSKVLNHTGVDWVGVLGLKACESLAQIGVSRHKLIPWSWPPQNRAETFEAKQLRAHPDPFKLIYAGPILSTRGVGDLLLAVSQLRAQGRNIHLKLIGKGDVSRFEAQAKRLQLDTAQFIERVPEHSLVYLIHQADLCVMPSRHESPEHSNTILNTCLQANTPIVASDHPMFRGSLSHGVNAMIYPAGSARALTHSIDYLMNHPDVYHKLSAASQTAWQSVQLPIHWISLLEHWFQDDSRQWMQQYALTSPRYQNYPSELLPVLT
ncbi:MAG: glycosyltransferase family 4 protein [Cyanobacteria bacterium P01_D01_bin.156]